MLIVMGQSGNRTPHNNPASSFFSPSDEHKTDSDRTSLVEVLSDLRDLLEDYSPAWYTEEQKQRLESALHGVCL
jgi:hypothetical protein